MLENSARRESSATRADVAKSVVAVRVYYGRTLVAASDQRMRSIGNGIGQISVGFTPRSHGTYTVVTSRVAGSWSAFGSITRSVTVR